MVTAPTLPSPAAIRRMLDEVVDPDIPVLTIDEIGILRDIVVEPNGAVTVSITPTYSGCPALAVMEEDIVTALATHGLHDVSVIVEHSPVWTTEWLSDTAKDKLIGYGIAAPSPVDVVEEVLCPRCSATGAAKVSEFSSTACRSLWVCSSCREPFDYFKAI